MRPFSLNHLVLLFCSLICVINSQASQKVKLETSDRLKEDDKQDNNNSLDGKSYSKENDTDPCAKAKTCEECVGIKVHTQCLWCGTTKTCKLYPFKNLVPSSEYCDWSDARWGVCWLDFKATLIAVSIIAGIVVLLVCCCIVKLCKCMTDCLHIIKVCCCWCCCCCRSGDSGYSKSEERSLKRLEEFARRQERREQLMLKFNMQGAKHKAAYGSGVDYEKFENSPI